LCPDHAAEAARCRAYRSLAAELGVDVEAQAATVLDRWTMSAIHGLEGTISNAFRDAVAFRRGDAPTRDAAKHAAQIGVYRVVAAELGIRNVDKGAPVGRRPRTGMSERQRAVTAQAFGDAMDALYDPDRCAACARSETELCGQHDAWQRLRSVYAMVAAELDVQPASDHLEPEAILSMLALAEDR
jgi:hypothetical protein